MDQFISMYQKDYPWPSTAIKRTTAALQKEDTCRCTDAPREIKQLERCGDGYDWSRTGPMGRLLDPKLYPAKTGPYPETEETKFDQPSTYMRKLEEKYPNLYGILQSTPMDDIIKRVEQDRMRTTYQIDFSDAAAAGMTEIAAGPCCVAARRQEKLDCQPFGQAAKSKRKVDSRDKKKKSKGKRIDEDSHETRLPPWRSEYQDGISKLGQIIMKTKIHHRKKAARTGAMAL